MVLRCYGLSAIHDDMSFVTGAGAGAGAGADAAAAATAAVTAATTQPLIQIGPLTPFDKGILYGVCKP